MKRFVTCEEMRQLEAASVAAGTTWASLMEQAGRGVADEALAMLGDPREKFVLLLVGPGNNGGDALVVARHLAAAGAKFMLYFWGDEIEETHWAWQALRAIDVPIPVVFSMHHTPRTLRKLAEKADLIVDGWLGIGVNRPLDRMLPKMVEIINNVDRPVLSIDVPTGLNADTGAIWGVCIKATTTVATGLAKRGHVLFPGAAYVGRLVVAPIDLPLEMEFSVQTTELNADILRSLLPNRPVDAHKDTFGRVLVVAGSYFYPGAAWLTAAAASRSGVGVVTLACPRSIYGATSAALHEATYLPLPEGEPGALSPAAVKTLRKRLGRYKALVIGPGLGDEEGTGDVLGELLGLGPTKHRAAVGFVSRETPPESHKRRSGFGFRSETNDTDSDDEEGADDGLPPLVLDADGLNLLAKIEHWEEQLHQHQVVITPHLGEMARLLKVETLDEDHVAVAADAAQRWGVVVVLKAAHTIIAAPDGQVALLSAANPALATAGSGDVLAGLLGGLLAQGLNPFDAARLAVGVHSIAGTLVKETLGGRGVVAGDLLPLLPQAWQRLEGAQ